MKFILLPLSLLGTDCKFARATEEQPLGEVTDFAVMLCSNKLQDIETKLQTSLSEGDKAAPKQ